jgi:hypothetical protein
MICPACHGVGFPSPEAPWLTCIDCGGCGIVHCCEGDKANPYHGSSLESFLDDEGFLEAATKQALLDVYEWEIKMTEDK